MKELQNRQSGLLCHPTCLPNDRDAIGTLGDSAYAFVDWLADRGQKLWQILPLNPTGYGDSPYASFSAFAGNPYLIDLFRLHAAGDLEDEDLADYKPPKGSAGRTDFEWLYNNKFVILMKAFARFKSKAKGRRKASFEKYCEANADWLEDYSLFMAIKASNNGKPWGDWEGELKDYGKKIDPNLDIIKEDYEFQRYVQWIFFEQWSQVRKYANSKGIKIIGDMPIFVAYDSSDVWAHQGLFFLNEDGCSTVVAGVPPDYFSETGQLWGNPLYKWDTMKKDGYAWWVSRIKTLLKLCDIVRIDHFRAFSQYWEVGADEETAINGTWVDGPGESFFTSLNNAFKDGIPIIAEDLGLITPDVEKLRDDFDLPGMKIFEFAPWGNEYFEKDGAHFEFKVHRYLPENYPRNCVGYLGTHDNDTFSSWYRKLPDNQREHVKSYLGEHDERMVLWAAVERLWNSDANMVVASVQDLLGLGEEARLNTPGTCGTHNWSWRLESLEALDEHEVGARLESITRESGR